MNAEPLSVVFPLDISRRMHHVFRPDLVCAVDRFSTLDHLYANRRPLWRRSPGLDAALPLTLSYFAICTVDVSRKPARHRGLSLGTTGQAVSHGSWHPGETCHSGRCQRAQRLTDLCRLCPAVDRPGAHPVCEGRPRSGFVENRLCLEFHDH